MERRSVIQLIKEYAQRQRRTRRWQWKVGGLACVVVLLTSYLLILPALTMSRENPVIKAAASSGEPGEILALEVVASPEEDQKETFFYLDTTAERAGLVEELYSFQDQSAQMTAQDGSLVELHQDIEGDAVKGYWFTLEKDRGETTLSLQWVSDTQQEEAAQALSAGSQGDGTVSPSAGGTLLVKAGSGSTLDEAKAAAEKVEAATTLSWVNADEVSAPEAAPMSEVTSGECGAQGDNLTWTLTGDGVLTISGTGKMADYSVRDPGLPPWSALEVKKVIIGDGVSSVGEYAFHACNTLTEVSISNDVTSIGDAAFSATALTSVVIPDGVTKIGTSAFEDCSSLETVDLPDGLQIILSSAFKNCSSLKSIVLPEHLQELGSNVFEGCKLLTSVSIPSVEDPGNSVFEDCTGLESVSFAQGITSISQSMFEGCRALRSITIVGSVQTIDRYAFYDTGIEEIYWNASGVTLGTNALSGSFRVIFGDGVEISAEAMEQLVSFGCTDFSSVEDGCFNLQGNLNWKGMGRPFESLMAGQYVWQDQALYRLEDGNAVLVHCKDRQTFRVPATVQYHDTSYSVTRVGTYAFAQCESLSTLEFERAETVAALEAYAFADARALTSINGKSTVTEVKNLFAHASIGAGAFWGTGLSGSTTAEPTTDKMVITGDGLEVTLETTGGEYEGTTQKLWTGKSAVVSIAISNPSTQSPDGKSIRIYFCFSTAKGVFSNYEIGKEYEYVVQGNSYRMMIHSTNVAGTYYMEIERPKPGDTLSVQVPVIYPTGTSEGGTLDLWGLLVDADSPEGQVLEAEQWYHSLRWDTQRIEYDIDAPNLSTSFPLLGDTKGGAYLNQAQIINVTMENKGDSQQVEGGLGADYRTKVIFRDEIKLPKHVYVAPEIVEALEKGNYTISQNNYYWWRIVFRLDNGESTAIELREQSADDIDVAIETDASGAQSLVLTWCIENSDPTSSELLIGKIPIVFPTNLFWIDDVEAYAAYYGDQEVYIQHHIQAESYYMYSDKAIAETVVQGNLQSPTSRIELNKKFLLSTSEKGNMGDEAPYQLSVISSGALPYTLNDVYATDQLAQVFYISAEGLEQMFAQAEEDGRYELQVTISKTPIYHAIERKQVTGVDGQSAAMTCLENTAYELMYDGMVLPPENTENIVYDNATLTLVADDDHTGYQLTITDENGSVLREPTFISKGQLQEKLWENGYMVNGAALYGLKWTFINGCELKGGESIQIDLPTVTKGTFEYIQQDYLRAYKEDDSTIYSPSNSAKLYQIGTDFDRLLDSVSYVRAQSYVRDFVLSYYGSVDGQVVTDCDLQLGDVIDCTTSFSYKGKRTYDVLPLVNKLYGIQVLLAPVAENQGRPWTTGLTTSMHDGVEYYELDRIGEYAGVWIGGKYADTVSVTGEGNSRETLIKWYYRNVTAGETIHYKTILKVTGDSESGIYYINNESWLNDSPTHRLYVPFGQIPIKLVDSQKKIVNSMTDTGPGVDRSAVVEGETVYYRFTIKQKYGQIPVTIKGSDMTDSLPMTVDGFQWSRENIKITVANDGSEQCVKGLDDWEVVASQANPSQQYIQWGDEFEVRVEGGNTVTLYVSLTFPEGNMWSSYEKEYGTTTLMNTLSVFGMRDTVYHDIQVPAVARLQKGVLYNAYGFDSPNLQRLQEYEYPREDGRLYYINNDYADRGVVYYVTLYNDGQSRLYLTQMQDVLPEGFTFYGIGGDPFLGDMVGSNDRSGCGVQADAEYVSVEVNADAQVLENGRTKVTFDFRENDIDGAAEYDEEKGLCYLKPGQALVFTYGCSTNNYEDTLDIASSTIAMPYLAYNGVPLQLDEAHPNQVGGGSYHENCISNEGSVELRDSTDMGSEYTYTSDTEQWLCSEVTSIRGMIQPGLRKVLNDEDGIANQGDTLSWTVTAYNNGYYPLDGYVITDRVQSPYAFIDSVDLVMYATGGSWNTTLKFQENSDGSIEVKPVSGWNSGKSATIRINGGAEQIVIYCQDGMTQQVLNMPVKIRIDQDETGAQILSLYFLSRADANQMNKNYTGASIPEDGRLEMTVHTKYDSTSLVNTVYINSAYLTPVFQKWDGTVAYGNLTTYTTAFTGDESLDTVRNSAPVTVTYGYATSSEKSVTQGNHMAYASGDPNYIILDQNLDTFTYTLSVTNKDKEIDKILLVDNLPEEGDHSSFAVEDPRFSEFKVAFAEDPNVQVSVIDQDGQERVLNPGEYTVGYSTKTEFDSGDWQGDNTEEWSETSSTARSIRVIVNSKIPAYGTVKVTFDAQIDDQAQAGETAWNSFGYHYWVDGYELEAAPLKVGVRVASVPELTKQLKDQNGVPMVAEQDMNFTFLIYTGQALTLEDEFTEQSVLDLLAAEGRQYAKVTLTVPQGNSESETLRLDPLEGYTYDEHDSTWVRTSWTWTENAAYTLLELPDPNDGFHFGSINNRPAISYNFSYRPGDTQKLTCVNYPDIWSIVVRKTDSTHELNLAGAVFALYSPVEADLMSEQDYMALTVQPDRTQTYEDETYYLTSVEETMSSGRLGWERLSRDKYLFLEVKAPDGYQIGSDNAPQLVEWNGENEATMSYEVVNTVSYDLPETGGIGTTPLYLTGGFIMVCAAVLYEYERQRKKGGTT